MEVSDEPETDVPAWRKILLVAIAVMLGVYMCGDSEDDAETAGQSSGATLSAVYAKHKADIRSGPSPDSVVVATVEKDQRLEYRTKKGGWYRLSPATDSSERWIHESSVWTLAEKNRPRWTSTQSKDEMTGKVSAHAHSPSTESTKPMEFPYTGVEAWLGFGCDRDEQWAYVGFTEAPNLNDADIRDGFNRVETRVKWDDSIKTNYFSQDWGAKFLHFNDDTQAIGHMVSSSTALLELNWHGSGRVYFEFSLNGSSDAIAEARAQCAG